MVSGYRQGSFIQGMQAMSITTTCPGCKALLRLPDDLAGKQVRCQKCKNMFTVPGPLMSDAAPPALAASPTEAPIEAKLAPEPPKEEIIDATLAEPPQQEVVQATLAQQPKQEVVEA